MIAYADFVTAFPEFSNATTYPQATVTYWIGVGYQQLNPRLLGTQLDLAVMLFAAFNVTIAAQNQQAANAGAIVGQITGPTTSKSVGEVSVGYSADTGIEGAGIYNANTYGQRLYRMLRSYGAGPHYVPGPRRARGRFAFS